MGELLVADLEEAALLAGCAKAVVRRVENVSPEAPCRYTTPFVISKPVEAGVAYMLQPAMRVNIHA